MFSMKLIDSKANIASPARQDFAQPAFILDEHSTASGLSAATLPLVGTKNVDSMDGPERPSASQLSTYCDNLYHEIMAKADQIENMMPPPGTESMRQLIETPDRRLAMLKEFEELMEMIDELFNNCRDFLPAEAIAEVRGARIDAERLRRALLIEANDPDPFATFAANLGTTIDNAAGAFFEGVTTVVGTMLAIGASLAQWLSGEPAH